MAVHKMSVTLSIYQTKPKVHVDIYIHVTKFQLLYCYLYCRFRWLPRTDLTSAEQFSEL